MYTTIVSLITSMLSTTKVKIDSSSRYCKVERRMTSTIHLTCWQYLFDEWIIVVYHLYFLWLHRRYEMIRLTYLVDNYCFFIYFSCECCLIVITAKSNWTFRRKISWKSQILSSIHRLNIKHKFERIINWN